MLIIGIARGGHSRANSLPSLNFAVPLKPSFYIKIYRDSFVKLLRLVVSARLTGFAMKCDSLDLHHMIGVIIFSVVITFLGDSSKIP